MFCACVRACAHKRAHVCMSYLILPLKLLQLQRFSRKPAPVLSLRPLHYPPLHPVAPLTFPQRATP